MQRARETKCAWENLNYIFTFSKDQDYCFHVPSYITMTLLTYFPQYQTRTKVFEYPRLFPWVTSLLALKHLSQFKSHGIVETFYYLWENFLFLDSKSKYNHKHLSFQDVLDSLQAKLGLKAMSHFSLVVEHVKSLKRNKLTLLNPRDTLAKVRKHHITSS